MSLNASDKRVIEKMITTAIDEALDYVDDDQEDQDVWMRRQISKINKSIAKLNSAVISLQTSAKWQMGLLIALFATFIGTIIPLMLAVLTP